MTKKILDGTMFAVVVLMSAAPALAGEILPTPVPLAGVGLVAFAALGVGYRALRNRIDR
jgi:hypothetical protein